jgi:hypothetical protein
MKHSRSLLVLAALAAPGVAASAEPKHLWKDFEKSKTASALHRVGEKTPLLVVNEPKDGRPYLHPIMAPDGKGALTESSPDHHKHQTGLYVGFLKVNGRDYFHNRGKGYFKGPYSRGMGTDGKKTHSRSFRYDLLDKAGEVVVEDDHGWHFTDHGDHLVLDLHLILRAEQDVTFGKHDYGGLFLRTPWRQKTGGKATNSEGQSNAKAEGQKARWVDVGMPIEGRKDWGRIAILDHKDSFRHPPLWRVDGQLGVGPAISRAGEWKLAKGKSITLKYRLVVYTGNLDKKLIEKAWKEFTGAKK